MNNIISFEEAKARRDQAKLVSTTKSDLPEMTIEKVPLNIPSRPIGVRLNDLGSPFIQEVKKFKFINMMNAPEFVIVNTKNLPPPFPPDPLPPLVA